MTFRPVNYIPYNPLPRTASLASQPLGVPNPLFRAGLPQSLGPNNQKDYPNPAPAQRVRDLLTHIGTPLPAGATPFAQRDWPNPRGYAQPPSITTQTLNLLEFFPFAAPSAPFVQGDWPLPISRPQQLDLKTFAYTAIPFMTAQGLIFPNVQTDWPNPPQARRVVDLLSFTRAPNPAPALPSPFFQTDWPNPPQAARRSEPDLRFAASTPFPAAAKPFSQADWPLAPAGRPYPLDARAFVQAPLKNVGTVTLYLAATDAADTFAASIFSAQPVAPSAARPSVGLQTGGGGFSSSQKDIPWNTAKDIVRRWYEAKKPAPVLPDPA